MVTVTKKKSFCFTLFTLSFNLRNKEATLAAVTEETVFSRLSQNAVRPLHLLLFIFVKAEHITLLQTPAARYYERLSTTSTLLYTQ